MNVKVVVLVLAVIAILMFVVIGLSVRPQGSATPTTGGFFTSLQDDLGGTRSLKASELEASHQGCVRPGGAGIALAPASACTIAIPDGVKRVALAPAPGSSSQVVVTIVDPKTVDQTHRPPDQLRFNVLDNGSSLQVSCPGLQPCALDLVK